MRRISILRDILWDELREKEFPNRVFADMSGVMLQLETGLPRLAADADRVRSITARSWIQSHLERALESKSSRLPPSCSPKTFADPLDLTKNQFSLATSKPRLYIPPLE